MHLTPQPNSTQRQAELASGNDSDASSRGLVAIALIVTVAVFV